MATENDGAVKIAVRERPMSRRTSENSESIVTYNAASKNIIIVNERPYEFDYCFGPNVNQRELYDELVKPLVEKTLEGYFCSTLAYGQTGTGKTFTMGVNKLPPSKYDEDGEMLCNDLDGVIPRALVDIFELSGGIFGPEISVSFIEIYNERVYDLLAEPSSDQVQTKGFKFTSGVRKMITNADQGFRMLAQGNKNRHIRPTKMNAESSRSHAIFTIHVSRKTGENRQIDSMLHLVDLAGSEGLRRTGHQGIAHTEGKNINKGLLAVGQVIRALVSKWKTPPYRESVLTSVLQDSLKSNSYLTLLVCISPLQEDLSETLYTLNFADDTKALKNTPLINSVMMDIKKNKVKTPYKSYRTPLSCNNSQTKALKRAFCNGDDGPLSVIRKPFHSNTFCTPNKRKQVSGKHLNQTDFGLTPKEKMMRFGDANLKQMQLNLPLNIRSKQSLNASVDSRSSLMSMNISTSTALEEPVHAMIDPNSVLYQTMRQELQNLVREEVMKVYSSMTGIVDHTVQSTIVTETCKNVSAMLIENQDDGHPYAESSPIFKKPQSPVISQCNITHRPTNESVMLSNMNVDETADTRYFHSSQIGDETVANETVVPQQRRQSRRFSQNPQEINPVRRSMRIARRNSTMITIDLTHQSNDDRRRSEVRKMPPAQSRESLRRSIRIEEHTFMMAIEEDVDAQFKIPKNTTRIVPTKNKTIARYFEPECKSARKKTKQECKSAQKIHEKAVLDLLNTGSIREIQILPQIGLKTAYQIITHRTLNGKFKSFEQFSKLPIWRGTGWERFKKANSIS